MKTLGRAGRRWLFDLLADRLRCPICGNRKIQLFFDIPNRPSVKKAAR